MARPVLSGMQEFRSFLGKQRAELCSTPVLLIESPTGNQGTNTGKSSELFQHVQHYCSSVGLRTSTTHPSSGYFPFTTDIKTALEFARRTGAGTIIGVGDSGAVGLARALSQESAVFENLILVPEDYGTLLSTCASHALVLDPDEEALLPHPSKEQIPHEIQTHIVLSDLASPARDDPAVLYSTAYAGLVLSLDNLYRGVENEEEAMSLITLASDLIDRGNKNEGLQNEAKQLQDLMMGLGASMNFGISSNNSEIRSVPLALSSSLLTKAFPDYDFIGFISCLLPGILSTLEGTNHNDLAMELSSRFLYRCPRIAKSSGDQLELQALVSQVHSNMAVWDCADADDAVLRQVLSTSLDL